MLSPLAFRLRPKDIHDVIGQSHLVGEKGFLTRSIEAKVPISIIFYGPPGTGKTTIAEAYAKSLGIHFIKLNAVTSNKKEMEQAIEEAKIFHPTIIIMDEVHRLNKDKQDILLPFIEDGSCYLLGCTTSNPYIAINQALRSRTHLLEVKRLDEDDVITGLKRAITSKDGLNNQKKFTEDALKRIAKSSAGDMRYALNYLEILSLERKDIIDEDDVKNVIRVPNLIADQDDDAHYNYVSALQKSIRGSDVDASLYYLACLAKSNDLDSIARRLLVTAYEDVGLANPNASLRTYIAIEAAKQVGFPEAIIPLAMVTVDLALSPKSKSTTLAIQKAMAQIEDKPLDVLDYLKLTPVNVKDEDKYPYDRPDLWSKMQYLPNLLKDIHFYEPWLTSSYEKALKENYDRLNKAGRSSNLRELRKEKK